MSLNTQSYVSGQTLSKAVKKCLLPLATVLFLVLGALQLSSCSKSDLQKKILRKVMAEVKVDGSNPTVGLYMTFDFGGLMLPSLEIGIMNPKSSNKIQYGHISFKPTIDGLTEVGVQVNLLAFSEAGTRATLPNGRDLPIGNLQDVQVIELPIENINGKVYLALDHNTVMIGFAMAIEQFDKVGNYLGDSNIFFPFVIKKVSGLAGIFTSIEPKKSGFGVFLDLSRVVSPDLVNEIVGGKKYETTPELASMNKTLLIKHASNKSSLVYKDTKDAHVTKEKEREAFTMLHEMAEKKEKVNFVKN